MENLKYRRQFIISKIELKELDHWKKLSIDGDKYLYYHPDLDVIQAQKAHYQITMLGIAINVQIPERTAQEIVNDILDHYQNWEDVIEAVYPLGGRWIVFASNTQTNEFKALTDPMGLRMCFFVKDNSLSIVCASQPLLIKDHCELTENQDFIQGFQRSKEIKKYKEFWFLSPYTQFEELELLKTNYYIDFETREQFRFYPLKSIPILSYQEGLEKTSTYLKNLVFGISKRSKVALAITGGYDSRFTLAACKDIKDDIFYFTSQYYGMKDIHPDLQIPSKLLPKLGLEHNIINCEGEMSPEFKEIYMKNIDLPHDCWGGIVENLVEKYPQDHILIKSACAEIARCAFYKMGYPKHEITAEWLGGISTIEDNPYMMEKLSLWLEEMKPFIADKNMNILDIYYWEHRCGYWQAGSQLEFDVAHEEFTPYSCRILIDSMLGVPLELRTGPQFKFFKDSIKYMWPEVLAIPFPTPFQKRIGILKKRIRKSIIGRAYYKILRILKIPH